MTLDLSALNDEQRIAVEYGEGPLLVISAAGSGKTRVLTYRAAHLIERGIDPSSIMLGTFTKKAATEMTERVAALAGDEAAAMHSGTLHSLFLRVLRAEGYPWREFDILDEYGQKRFVRDLLGKSAANADLASILGQISLWKNDLVGVEQAYEDDPYTARIFAEYEDEKRDRCVLDFDDMLTCAVELFEAQPETCDRYRRRTPWLLIDEAQDTSTCQWRLLEMLAGAEDGTIEGRALPGGPEAPASNLTVVADWRQAIYCQPEGTMVGVPARGTVRNTAWPTVQVPIESLQVGDLVVTYDHSHVFKRGRSVTHTTRLPYEGPLVRITTEDGTSSAYTPWHHCIARIGDELRDKHVVYLMRRGEQYRIGRVPVFYASQAKAFGLRQRAIQEGADGGWILSVHDTVADAALAEALAQHQFNIPGVRFTPTGPGDVLDVVAFWNKHGDNRTEAEACLDHFGRRIDSPLWSGDQWIGTRRPFVTAAANLIDGFRVLLLGREIKYAGKRDYMAPAHRWEPACVTREWYQGDIVSIEVADHHTYYGDGILTHNSWRGARPEMILDFEARFPGASVVGLPRNYRSTENIVEAANVLIRHAGRELDDMVAHRPRGADPFVTIAEDPDLEASNVVGEVQARIAEGASPGSFAVLYRVNSYSRSFEEAFASAGIPYVVVGSTGFFGRKEVADLIAYLQFVHDGDNEDALRRIVNRPTRFLGKAYCDAVVLHAREEGIALRAALVPSTLSARQVRNAYVFRRDLDELNNILVMGNGLRAGIRFVRGQMGYDAWLLREEGSGATDENRIENLAELENVAARYKSVESFLAYMDMQRSKSKSDDTSNRVQLMTIHRSKGLEWPTVFAAGFAEGIIPHKRSTSPAELEEERRLAYVAVTRARDELFVSCPLDWQGRSLSPSRFVYEAALIRNEIAEAMA